MDTSKRSVMSSTACVLLLAACSTGTGTTSADPSTTPTPTPVATTVEAAPFHAIPDDPVVVTGTATCTFSTTAGVNPEGGAGLLVTCELDMSDPRVSGTETDDRFRFFKGGEAGDVWVAEEATITNGQGAWRGSMQAADDGIPCGEAHFVGEGAYEGLEFHYYLGPGAGGDDAVLKGWISGDG